VITVGLTGGIGSGKSTVSGLLASYGAVVIDADVLAREAVATGTPGLGAVVVEFGSGVLAADGSLDRKRLAEIVFTKPDRRAALESIVHPLVRDRSRQLVAGLPDDAVVVHEVPLLVEKGMEDDFDVVVVVDASDELRVRRLVDHRGLSAPDAAARIAAQADRATRLASANIVVPNDGPPSALAASVEALWSQLAAMRPDG